MSVVIKVENLAKQYRLGLVGSGTIKDDFNRWWANFRGKENPLLKVGEKNDRTLKGNSSYVWSLKDISFEVNQGDVLGIVGKNGAGKSTLLKILSRVTAPTTGVIKSKGRIASLLEVGTGFHPELTGRENIFLNGAILGMKKNEITRKLDEIIAFAGVDRYIDTPVKRYSSGMYVRLAFAVAAHLESEILIVDEVLAVGDAEFQKKCLGKIKDVSSGEGRTVLFVSHNIAAIRELCNKGLMLENGSLNFSGEIKNVIDKYMMNSSLINSDLNYLQDYKTRRGNGEARFINININNNQPNIDPTKDLTLKFNVKILKQISELSFCILIKNHNNEVVVSSDLILIENNLDENTEINFSIVIPANTFRTGMFPLYLWLGKNEFFKAENYLYDVIDGLYYLNFVSNKEALELGYHPNNPLGYVNSEFKLIK